MAMRWTRALTSLLCGACAATPTQLVVVVDTNLDVPAELDLVEVAVTGPDGIQTVTPQALDEAGAPGLPLTLGVAPEGEVLGPIDVAAIGRLGGVEVVRTGATGITLRPGESRVLHLVLVRACVGRECASDERCGLDGCAADAAGELPLWSGEPPPFDDSDPCLGLRWDADGDGDGSAACGGADCDDDDAAVRVGAPEACNGIDDDCDGEEDEGCDCTPLGAMETCTSSCGTTGSRRCEEGGWSACTPPAEICNAADDDCDGHVDEGYDWLPSTPVNVSANAVMGNRSNEPDLAWSGDRFGVVWHDSQLGDGLHFTTIDAAGVVGPSLVAVAPGRTPAIAFGGGVFAIAAWWLEAAGQHRLHVRMVRPDGTFASDTVRVVTIASEDPRPRVVWDGAAFVVAGLDEGRITYQRIGPDGVALGRLVVVPAARSERADLAYDGARLAFAWSTGGTLFATRGSDVLGWPMDATTLAASAGAEGAGLGWLGGDDYLIAWRAMGTMPTLELARVDLAAPGADPIQVVSTTRALRGAGTPNAIFVDVAEANGQALVTWADARDGDAAPHAARFARDGAMLQGPTRVAPMPSRGEPIRAAWTGDAFGVVWEEQDLGHPTSEVYFTRLGCP